MPVNWSDSDGIAWRTEIPGRGWSSPVIEGKQIWLTTAIETLAKPEDAARRLKANTSDQPLNLLEKVELRAVCVDRKTGRVTRDLLLLTEPEPQWVHQLNNVSSREGVTDVVAPGRSFMRLARNELLEKTMASLAVADGALFLRSDRSLYRLEQKGR